MMILFQSGKGEKLAIKKRRIENAKADSVEKCCNYVIGCLNLADAVHES